MPDTDHDLIIVGAGPAGSATALHLAKRSPALAERTLILERERHPRQKLCCGGLTGDALRGIERLGLDLNEIPNIRADRLHLLFEGSGFPIRVAGDFAFGVIRRNELDAWLADKARKAGFTIQEDTHVTSLRRCDGGIEVHTDRGTLRAKAIVGADGSTSVVRHAFMPRSHVGIGRSLEVITPAASGSFPALPCGDDDGCMEFKRILTGIDGYTLSFPVLEGGVRKRSWAIWDSRASGHGRGPSLEPLLRDAMAAHGFKLGDHEVRGFPIRWYERGVRLSAPNVLLAGDAAGADALMGEGISQAIGYGEIAAGALADAFERGRFDFADYTDRVDRSPLGRSLAIRTWLARHLYSVRSRALQRLLWQRGGKLLEVLLKRHVFGWAK